MMAPFLPRTQSTQHTSSKVPRSAGMPVSPVMIGNRGTVTSESQPTKNVHRANTLSSLFVPLGEQVSDMEILLPLGMRSRSTTTAQKFKDFRCWL